MRLPYLVQQSDGSEKFGKDGFEFGGYNGGLAKFLAPGDAILFAQEMLRRQPAYSVRVLNEKGHQVYYAAGTREKDYKAGARDKEYSLKIQPQAE